MPVNAQMQPLGYGISHATSTDGIHFTPQPNNPQLSGAAQPSVVKDPTSGVWELFYVSDTDQEKATELEHVSYWTWQFAGDAACRNPGGASRNKPDSEVAQGNRPIPLRGFTP